LKVTVFCPGRDISATVPLISMKFYTMVELCTGRCFSPSSVDIFRGLQMWSQERASGGPSWPLKTSILPLDCEYIKMVNAVLHFG